MPFRNYDYFSAIVDEGNITKAAAKLFISQPSLSKYLQRLEEALGAQLFDRSKTPLTLTMAGARYLEHVRQLALMERSLKNDLQDLSAQSFGVIRVGVTPWHAMNVMPRLLKSFCQTYPGMRVELFERYSTHLEKMVMNDNVDFCLMMQPHDVIGQTRLILKNQRIDVAISKDNPLIGQLRTHPCPGYALEAVDLAMLQGQQIIMPKQGHVFSQVVSACLAQSSVYTPTAIEVENITTALGMVMNNLGITFVMDGAMARDTYRSIAFYAIDMQVHAELCVVCRAYTALSPHAKRMVDHIVNAYAQGLL